MDKSCEEKTRSERIDLLYKNLEHVSAAYFTAEGVYPYWEAAFAIIIGQIFIAYYGQGSCASQQIYLAFFGVVLSLIWFLLVSLNLQYAIYIEGRARVLQNMLKNEYEKNGFRTLEFIEPWVKDKLNWSVGNIFWGTVPDGEEETKSQWFATLLKSTWFYRRALPFMLLMIWISVLPWGKLILCAMILIILLIFTFFFTPTKRRDATIEATQRWEEIKGLTADLARLKRELDEARAEATKARSEANLLVGDLATAQKEALVARSGEEKALSALKAKEDEVAFLRAHVAQLTQSIRQLSLKPGEEEI